MAAYCELGTYSNQALSTPELSRAAGVVSIDY